MILILPAMTVIIPVPTGLKSPHEHVKLRSESRSKPGHMFALFCFVLSCEV